MRHRAPSNDGHHRKNQRGIRKTYRARQAADAFYAAPFSPIQIRPGQISAKLSITSLSRATERCSGKGQCDADETQQEDSASDYHSHNSHIF